MNLTKSNDLLTKFKNLGFIEEDLKDGLENSKEEEKIIKTVLAHYVGEETAKVIYNLESPYEVVSAALNSIALGQQLPEEQSVIYSGIFVSLSTKLYQKQATREYSVIYSIDEEVWNKFSNMPHPDIVKSFRIPSNPIMFLLSDREQVITLEDYQNEEGIQDVISLLYGGYKNYGFSSVPRLFSFMDGGLCLVEVDEETTKTEEKKTVSFLYNFFYSQTKEEMKQYVLK